MTLRSACLLLSLAAITSSSCERREETADRSVRRGGALAPSDSVMLSESAEYYIGSPYSFKVDPFNGEFLVSDYFSKTAYRFSRDGDLVLRYGRPGGGPGEFSDMTTLFVKDDSTVAIADNLRRVFSFFDRLSGEYKGELRYGEGVLGYSDPVPSGTDGRFLLPALNLTALNSIISVPLDTGEVESFGFLPDQYVLSITEGGRAFAGFLPYTYLEEVAGDTLVLGFGGHDEVFLIDRAGVVLDTIPLPRLYRRGVPENAWQIFANTKWTPEYTPWDVTAGLHEIAALRPDRLVSVHHQRILVGELAGGKTTSTVFLSIISNADGDHCVDVALAAGRDDRPVHTIQNDTLFVLDRRIANERLESWVLLYPLKDIECPAGNLM